MMVISQQKHAKHEIESNEWTLTSHQMLFLMQNQNAIEKAYADSNLDFLRQFAESKVFKDLFGDMGFDEAYDRYESTLEAGDAT
ncbi:MAG: hypothetical protein ABI970_17355 [Chloroflexota bacterium]